MFIHRLTYLLAALLLMLSACKLEKLSEGLGVKRKRAGKREEKNSPNKRQHGLPRGGDESSSSRPPAAQAVLGSVAIRNRCSAITQALETFGVPANPAGIICHYSATGDLDIREFERLKQNLMSHLREKFFMSNYYRDRKISLSRRRMIRHLLTNSGSLSEKDQIRDRQIRAVELLTELKACADRFPDLHTQFRQTVQEIQPLAATNPVCALTKFFLQEPDGSFLKKALERYQKEGTAASLVFLFDVVKIAAMATIDEHASAIKDVILKLLKKDLYVGNHLLKCKGLKAFTDATIRMINTDHGEEIVNQLFWKCIAWEKDLNDKDVSIPDSLKDFLATFAERSLSQLRKYTGDTPMLAINSKYRTELVSIFDSYRGSLRQYISASPNELTENDAKLFLLSRRRGALVTKEARDEEDSLINALPRHMVGNAQLAADFHIMMLWHLTGSNTIEELCGRNRAKNVWHGNPRLRGEGKILVKYFDHIAQLAQEEPSVAQACLALLNDILTNVESIQPKWFIKINGWDQTSKPENVHKRVGEDLAVYRQALTQAIEEVRKSMNNAA